MVCIGKFGPCILSCYLGPISNRDGNSYKIRFLFELLQFEGFVQFCPRPDRIKKVLADGRASSPGKRASAQVLLPYKVTTIISVILKDEFFWN